MAIGIFRVFKPRRGKRSTAISKDIVLDQGEVFFEVPNSGVGTGKGKIVMGDGLNTYEDLPYFIDPDDAKPIEITYAQYQQLSQEEILNNRYIITDYPSQSVENGAVLSVNNISPDSEGNVQVPPQVVANPQDTTEVLTSISIDGTGYTINNICRISRSYQLSSSNPIVLSCNGFGAYLLFGMLQGAGGRFFAIQVDNGTITITNIITGTNVSPSTSTWDVTYDSTTHTLIISSPYSQISNVSVIGDGN